MEFNYNDVKSEVLKAILRIEEKHNIIIVGSYALYKIHFNKKSINIDENIEIKDLDIDLYKIDKKLETKNINEDEKMEFIKKIIKSKINLNFYKIVDQLYKYENIKNVNIDFDLNSLVNRPYNKDTKGLFVFLTIEDYEDNEHLVKFDVNLEYKNFIVENKEIQIDNETFNAKVYELHKILADKYLAITKRIIYLQNEIKKQKLNEKDLLSNNIKLNKDIFDLIFIKNNLKVDNDILNEYILKMTLDKNINEVEKIKKTIDKIILTNNNLGKTRKSKFNIFELFKNLNLRKEIEILDI